jgi:hypothetical protein
MTWAATGEVAKAPKGMVIEDGVYVGMQGGTEFSADRPPIVQQPEERAAVRDGALFLAFCLHSGICLEVAMTFLSYLVSG